MVAFFLFKITTLSPLYIIGISVGLFILFIGLIFLPPLLQYPNENRYKIKFEKYQEEQYRKKVSMAVIEMRKKSKDISLFSLFGVNEEHPYYSYIKLTIYLIVWSVLAFILGTIPLTSTYSIANIENKDYVVLGTYSSKFILVGINREKKVTTSEILLINNEKDLRITRNNIGVINENISKRADWKIF